eukprot:EG_transcript_41781
MALHCIALHCIALHCIALHCIALHCIALHCITLHCIALHYITLITFMTLHYITAHAQPDRIFPPFGNCENGHSDEGFAAIMGILIVAKEASFWTRNWVLAVDPVKTRFTTLKHQNKLACERTH